MYVYVNVCVLTHTQVKVGGPVIMFGHRQITMGPLRVSNGPINFYLCR